MSNTDKPIDLTSAQEQPNKEIKLLVKHQGAPMASYAYMIKESPDVIALAVDMQTRCCEISGTSSGGGCGPGIMVCATDNAHPLMSGVPKCMDTWIEFPEYVGWSMWSVHVSKYTLAVCLIKDDPLPVIATEENEMRKELKPVWVSDDGQEFTTKELCAEHEARIREEEFVKLLGYGGESSYWVSELNGAAITSFADLKKFCTDNRDWVLINCMNIQPEDLQ